MQLATRHPGATPGTVRAPEGAPHRTRRAGGGQDRARPAGPEAHDIGVGIEPAVTDHLPLKVSIDLGRVGGPSAGLAFALDILEKSAATSTMASRSRRPERSTSTGRSARSEA